MNSDNEGFLSVKEMAEKWPIGSDPERIWQKWITGWKDKEMLYPSVHFRSVPHDGHCVRVFLYAERYLLKLAYNAGRESHCTPLLCEFFSLYAEPIRLLFLSSPESKNAKPSISQENVR